MNCAQWEWHLDAYLAVQRAVGKSMVVEEKLLRDFLDHCSRSGATSSGQAAMDWARTSSSRFGSSGEARRLTVVFELLAPVLLRAALAADITAARSASKTAVRVLWRRNGGATVSCWTPLAARLAAATDLSDDSRAAGLHRPSRRRSDPSRGRGLATGMLSRHTLLFERRSSASR